MKYTLYNKSVLSNQGTTMNTMTTRTTYSPCGIRNEEEYWLFEACEAAADYKMTLAPHTLDNYADVLADCTLRAYRYYDSLGYNAMSLYHRIYG